MDCVLLFNVLHTRHPLTLLREAHRILKSSGYVVIMNWTVDPANPYGPPFDMRPRVEQCVDWCIATGYDPTSKAVYELPPYHYGLRMKKG
jgi:SAM-dependent methyltransferase